MKNIPMILIIIIALVISGCTRHTDPEPLSYTEEIKRYINKDSELGEFLTIDLHSLAPFKFDKTSRLYFYKIDSVTREIYPIIFAGEPKNIEPYHIQNIYDARAQVLDVFYGNFYSINGVDTNRVSKFIDSLNRYIYFLKLYNNSYRYAGWYFWGFAGGEYERNINIANKIFTDVNSDIIFSGGRPNYPIPDPTKGLKSFEIDTLYIDTVYDENTGDSIVIVDVDTIFFTPTLYIMDSDQDTLYYLQLLYNLPLLNPHDSLYFQGGVNDRIFARNATDSIQIFKTSASGGKYISGWRIPSGEHRYTNLIFFDEPGYFDVDTIYLDEGRMYESTLVKQHNYVIPYRIKQ